MGLTSNEFEKILSIYFGEDKNPPPFSELCTQWEIAYKYIIL